MLLIYGLKGVYLFRIDFVDKTAEFNLELVKKEVWKEVLTTNTPERVRTELQKEFQTELE